MSTSTLAPGRRTRRSRTALLGMLVVPALALTTVSPAAAGPISPNDQSQSVPANAVYIYSVHATSGDLVSLATRLDAAGYEVTGRDGESLWIQGSAATRASLEGEVGLAIDGAQALTYQPPAVEPNASQDPILPKKLDGRHYETFYGGYRTVDAFHKFEDDLQTAYPKLVKVIDYGTSYTGDNKLRAICITADADKGCKLTPDVDKARFLLMAQIHARELSTSEVAWRYMTSLIDGYNTDAQATAVLTSTEVWVVPEINPDGIETVQQGIEDQGTGYDSPGYHRKNMNTTAEPPGGCQGQYISSHPGIDINRNFDSYYGGASTSKDPCSEVYIGTKAGSEPETTALGDFFKQIFKDQRGSKPNDAAPATTTGSVISLHTYANLVVFPWEYNAGVHSPNDAGLRSEGFRLSHYNGYETGQTGEVLYNASGTSNDYAYDQLGIASFTFEMGPGGGTCAGFLPAYSCQDDFWKLNEPALYYAATAARQPYKLGLGPTTTDVKAKVAGGKVTITGTTDDDAYGDVGVGRPASQNIKAARLYVGKAPWDGGKAVAMTIKGSGKSVQITGSVKPGKSKQLAYVQGQDADGNWGPVAAVWIPKQ